MSLKSLLDLTAEDQQYEVTEEKIRNNLQRLRRMIAFYREYPDILVDLMAGPDGGPHHFKFYFYQRIFLRVVMRHRFVYATFPRAFSKSFLTMMALMLKAILFPGAELFVTTGGKEQAASITIAKIEEICRLIPAFENEINWSRGKSKKTKDSVEYIFKNGSKINILPASERSRGQRRTGGVMEECVSIDQDILNEVIIPTTNVDRLLPDGTRDRKEVVNKCQTFITTAGWKNTFAYDKLVEILIQSVLEPDEFMIMGGTCEIPIQAGLLDKDFVEQLKLQGTYNEDSFNREYRSMWSGDALNAFYSADKFDKCRQILLADDEYNIKGTKDAYYVIGVDVGRFNCTTEAIICKVVPQPQGTPLKCITNIYTYESEHFEQQSIHLKKLFFRYKAKAMAVDANGIGAGLVDFLTIAQTDPETGDVLPPFGVMNDEDGKYRKLKTYDTVDNALYLIKANAALNTEAYSYAQVQMSSGKTRFLIDESQAKTKLMSTKVGQSLSNDQKNEYLRPYVLTTILREQLLNLVQENEGVNIILKQSSKSIKKDKVSALIYCLYYVKQEEDQMKRKRRGRSRLSDFMFFN